MDFLTSILDLFLHLDTHLSEIIHDYGTWTYLILYGIVFCETGLVVTPFLPGDSLLFAAGTLAAVQGSTLNVSVVCAVLILAAFCGDNVNYWVGKFLGPRVFRGDQTRFLKREHLDRTHAFFEKYGGKTIILARFVPIVRTFTPFVAGLGAMTYPRFLLYSIFAACLWVGVCVMAGYFFGRIPVVQEHFSLAILAIILISIAPALVEYVRHRRRTTGHGAEPAVASASEDQ